MALTRAAKLRDRARRAELSIPAIAATAIADIGRTRSRPTFGDQLLGRQQFGVTSAVHGGERAIANTAPTIEPDWNQHKECVDPCQSTLDRSSVLCLLDYVDSDNLEGYGKVVGVNI
jgi:hypothetical protein